MTDQEVTVAGETLVLMAERALFWGCELRHPSDLR
jgi:hypothetical protein